MIIDSQLLGLLELGSGFTNKSVCYILCVRYAIINLKKKENERQCKIINVSALSFDHHEPAQEHEFYQPKERATVCR